ATEPTQKAYRGGPAGLPKQIAVATTMAGRGTETKPARRVADMGGLHVIATEPHGSGRVDRQLFGRAARQGDPGSAQMFCSLEDDLFVRHARYLRNFKTTVGKKSLLKISQAKAEHIAG